MLSSGRKLQDQHLRVGAGAPQAPDLLVPRDSSGPPWPPLMPTRADPAVRQSGKAPPQTDPPFPTPAVALLASLPSADPSPTRRLPFTAAPDALHPPGSQARCPGQGAASSSSSTPRKAASMASKEGRAAEPAAARPPAILQQQRGAMATGRGGKRCGRRGRLTGKAERGAQAGGGARRPVAQPGWAASRPPPPHGGNRTAESRSHQDSPGTSVPISPNSRQTTSATGLFIYCQHSDIPRQPCSSPVKTSVIIPISSHI